MKFLVKNKSTSSRQANGKTKEIQRKNIKSANLDAMSNT